MMIQPRAFSKACGKYNFITSSSSLPRFPVVVQRVLFSFSSSSSFFVYRRRRVSILRRILSKRFFFAFDVKKLVKTKVSDADQTKDEEEEG